MVIPIDGTLAEILKMTKEDIDRRRKLEAHLQILDEKEKAQIRILKQALEERVSVQKAWETASTPPLAEKYSFGSLSWITAEEIFTEKVEQTWQRYSAEMDLERKLMEDLERIHEEKKKTLEALKEYKLEGGHCIIF
ncbi:MAG: hypothetical protein KGI80_05670 [Verrucomicrobiota bacterium]|nr:hypothetical protein [Verrucomicrobiota bacterium]